ncbi:hypothetical protein RHGRI_005843 [Rhododendron griersonianum]|uniref:DUF4283 domain-containing protein n=1 Tax=Rhododendron griersonianum TaxID=479676 RepID=A0AAV6LDQ1_9ERIC|nr:hypothetical protein RHGRI_005843 [Rhododendron griersonianum]
MKIWQKFGIYEVLANDQGLFFFKFGQNGAHHKVIESDPWHIAGKLLILQPWKPQMVLQKDKMNSIPMWVQFANVPLEFWIAQGLSYIVSAVGKPLTKKGKGLSFAKACIEIDVESWTLLCWTL